MMRRVDVLVIGLGPAGASAAAQAARAGLRVLAVDRRRVPGCPVQCAEFVPASLASEVPVLRACVQQSIASMRTFVEGDPPDDEPRFPGHMLDRAAFDAALVSEAAAAGATCAFGTAVRAISGAPEPAVELGDGRRIAARVLVGADGPHSIVGRAIGVTNRQCVETRQITVALVRSQTSTDVFLSRDIPGGYGWLFPKRQLANLGAGVAWPHHGRLKAIVAGLHERLVAERVVGAAVLGMTGGAIPVGGMLDPVAAIGTTQVLLAGDAAGLSNPITGAGIAAAVLSGRLAGRAAADYLGGDHYAPRAYRDELEAVFGASLARALRHRRALEDEGRGGKAPARAALRRSWIAYPEYWAAPRALTEEVLQ